MKRGLVVLDPSEIADKEWAERVTALQRHMSVEGLDVVLVYGDVFRSDDIGYLTNLCIYWNDGVVAIPAHGDPIFLTKFSPRVHTWMRRTSKVSDLRSGKSFAQLVTAMLAERPVGVVGLVDAGLWPDAVVQEIRDAVSGWELRLLGPVVRDQRQVPSAAELALLRQGARALSLAVDEASDWGLDIRSRIATVELALRGGGFTDVMVETAQTRHGVASLSVTGEYRHGWLHCSRLVSSGDDEPWTAALRAALAAAVAAAHGGVTSSQLTAAAEPHLTGLPEGVVWSVRCVNQTDMATNGELEQDDLGKQHPTGAVVVVTVEVLLAGLDRAVVADTVLLGTDGAEVLTTSGKNATPDAQEQRAR